MKDTMREAALALIEKPEEVRRHYVRYEGRVTVDGGVTEEYTVLGHKIHKGFWDTEDQYYMDPASKRFHTGKEMDMVYELIDMIELEVGA